MRWSSLLCLTALLCGAPPAGAQDRSAGSIGRPPNIVLVFVDDMGYADLSVTGNPHVRTENIDRLAAEGIRFTQFYANSPICSPSRVALTTGMYPSRWGIHSFIHTRQHNREREMADWLDVRAPTLARALKDAGYATGHFGKWHMGGGRDVGDAPLITEYGFDESITSFEGLGDRYLWREQRNRLNEQSAELGRGRIWWTEKHQMTRHYVDHAIDFMRRHRDGPFYLNLWPNDVHDAHVPRPELVEKYAGVARNEYEKRFFAVLEEMDRQLGRLFDEIDRLGLAEETVVLLTSDNGPTDWPRYYREGVEPPGSTGPFRGRKWSLYEGGIRMPLLVRWPGRIPAGRVDEETVMAAMDLFPSLARIAGAPLPEEHRLDGEDLGRAFFGRPVRRERPIFWFYPNDHQVGTPRSRSPKLAMREGRWKLLVEEDGTGAELYDLQVDPVEATDLARIHPRLVERFREKVLRWERTLPRGETARPASPGRAR